ncbi:MAG: CPBP family intramembrane glutamic endopeptidase [Microbacteriaceae bacterium]
MLSPSNPSTPWVLGLVVLGVLLTMVLRAVRKDRREYTRFKRMRATRSRQRQFRTWVWESFRLYGTTSIITIVLAWQFIPLLLADVNRWGWVAAARGSFASSGLGLGILVGVVVSLIGGAVLGIYAARPKTDEAAEVPALGDVQALLPRNRAELRWGAALSLNAGLVEELMFRLALPAAIYGITVNAAVAIAASLAVFGLLHVYQGVVGILASTLIGAFLMMVYLATGNIFIAIIVHALFDLRSLVLIPIVIFKVHQKS